MEVEGEGKNKKVAGEIFEIGVRSGRRDVGIHGEGEDAERKTEGRTGKGAERLVKRRNYYRQ